jgi:hypothetical protein
VVRLAGRARTGRSIGTSDGGAAAGRGPIAASALALSVALLVTACSDSSEASVDLASAPVNPTGEQLFLPLDEYQFVPSEMAVYERARDVTVADCMAQQGFEYPVLARPDDDAAKNAARYGLANPDDAATFGYHQPPRSADLEALMAANSEAHSPEWGQALHGVGDTTDGPGGCLAAAYEQLGGAQSYFEDTQFVEELAADSYERSTDHAQVKDVIGQWKECLAGAGYPDAESPNEFSSSVLRAEAADERDLDDPVVKPGQQISAAEIAAATADATCQRDVNLVGIWFAVESALQQELIDEHAEALSEIAQRKDERLRLAAQVASL